MSLSEIMEELPRLTFVERQELIREAVALDDAHMTQAENDILEQRMADFKANPGDEVSLEEMQKVVLRRLEAKRGQAKVAPGTE